MSCGLKRSEDLRPATSLACDGGTFTPALKAARSSTLVNLWVLVCSSRHGSWMLRTLRFWITCHSWRPSSAAVREHLSCCQQRKAASRMAALPSVLRSAVLIKSLTFPLTGVPDVRSVIRSYDAQDIPTAFRERMAKLQTKSKTKRGFLGSFSGH